MTNDSFDDRTNIAKLLGFYSFEDFQNYAHNNNKDADDLWDQLIWQKIDRLLNP